MPSVETRAVLGCGAAPRTARRNDTAAAATRPAIVCRCAAKRRRARRGMCLAKLSAHEHEHNAMTAGMASRLTLRRTAAAGILTFAAGALTFGAHAQQAAARQSVDEIRAAARELVLKTLGTDTNAVVEAVAIDERLSLPACTQELDAQLRGELRNGQGVVVVSCAGKSAWRLFVPVRVSEQIGVVIARRSIAAGEILTADDLETRKQSSSALPYDFIGDPAQAVGLTVRRGIPSGTVLVPAALEHPEIIERGALVTLVSGGGSVSVRSEGVALQGGRLNQRVRVRSPSGRVVEGVVEASGEVRVGT